MGLYNDWILPHVLHLSMRQNSLAPYRRRIIPAAAGRVLEIGVGSGLNLPLYTERAMEVIGLEPSPKLLSMARRLAGGTRPRIELVEGSAETIPLDAGSVDTVVTTWTLCTIPDVGRALGEMRRVLRPDGRLLFVEHGLAPDLSVRRWQDRLTPLTKRVGGGCHLNRPIRDLIANAGFEIEQLDAAYMEGVRAMAFTYEGVARPVPGARASSDRALPA
jgi:ubiquinone/menaquinone biosynthesis C-methylase UbiE